MRNVPSNGRLGRPSLAALAAAALILLVAGCAGGQEEEAAQQRGGQEEDGGDAPAAQGAGGEWPVVDVAAEVEPSVVQVNVRAGQQTPYGLQEGEGVGSGVIYTEDGYIVTNNHVVEGANEVNVAFADGTTEEGEVVGTDPFTDLAVVKVDRSDLPAANFVENSNLRLGELAVAVGSPSGFQSTVTAGVVSGLNREIPAEITGGQTETSLVDLIQTDAAISPGNSGGALANIEGDVIGVNVAYLPPTSGAEGIGFAIPSTTAISVVEQIIDTGEATQPYVGVSLANLTPDIAEQFGIPTKQGALVIEVDPDGPAADAGIEPRSVVTAVGDQEVQNSGDLLGALRDYRPGDQVELTIAQGDDVRQVSIELGELAQTQ